MLPDVYKLSEKRILASRKTHILIVFVQKDCVWTIYFLDQKFPFRL